MIFSVLGGPGYTPDYGVLIGGSAIFTFSTDFKDTTLRRSILPISFAYIFEGGGNIRSRPQIFFKRDRMRLFGEYVFNNNLENYHGVGYHANSTRKRSPDSTQYRNIGYRINPVFFFRLPKTQFFVGASMDYHFEKITDPSPGVYLDKDYIEGQGDSLGWNNINFGLGLNLSYDTRDIPSNAYSGLSFEGSLLYYPEDAGTNGEFSTVNLEYSQYLHLGKRRVLAWNANGRFTFGNPPITELSMIGSPFDLRGYYLGQFRDKNAVYAIVEYRHMIDFGSATMFQRIMSRFGFAAWGGLGSIGSSYNEWSPVLPNYGAGLRIEVQPRMNFRVDFGVDPINQNMLVYFNVTEAF